MYSRLIANSPTYKVKSQYFNMSSTYFLKGIFNELNRIPRKKTKYIHTFFLFHQGSIYISIFFFSYVPLQYPHELTVDGENDDDRPVVPQD